MCATAAGATPINEERRENGEVKQRGMYLDAVAPVLRSIKDAVVVQKQPLKAQCFIQFDDTDKIHSTHTHTFLYTLTHIPAAPGAHPESSADGP
jgi:hypothetical protein